ncbi:MAG: PqqD family protein [Elusimicrobia bacterium]|nr:PqqD family protein [Elusimicrobiota bacterium]
MNDPKAYDEQLKKAWQGGDYSTTACPKGLSGSEAPGWSTPELESAPDRLGARDLSRREVESIVSHEAVTLSNPEVGAESCPEARMKLAKFVKFREEKFGGVLFETRNEKVYTLNPTGAAVVREIVAGSADVVKALQEKYDDKSGTIAAEASSFLEDLKTKGLVEA